MKQQTFERRYGRDWESLETWLNVLESPRRHRQARAWYRKHAAEFPALYRRVCQHLALAQSRHYSAYLIDRLNRLALRGHQQLYRRRTAWAGVVGRFFARDFPALVRREARWVGWAMLLFYGTGLAMGLAVWLMPELVYSVFPPGQVAQFEAMYDPSAEHIGRPRDADTDVLMFAFYIQNNISVAFRTFAGGMALGLGSLFFLGYNGLVLGGVGGHLTGLGFVETFWPFVIGHGSFELTAIVLSGAAGLKLGYALVDPGPYRRAEALRRAARVSVKLMYGVMAMLVIAACLEAFWSSSVWVPVPAKLTVGALLWTAVILYFWRWGRATDAV